MTDWPRLTARRLTPISEWMTVVSRDVQFSPNASVETYYAIKQPNYLTALATTPEGRILLVRQYRPAIERYSLELPGGLLDQGEDPAIGVARELLEETGYTTETITLIGKTATCSSRISITCILFSSELERVSQLSSRNRVYPLARRHHRNFVN